MKKILNSLLTSLLFAFAIAVLLGAVTVKVSAAEFSADLDGDGTDDTIVYEIIDTESRGKKFASFAINGKDVLTKIQLEDNFYTDILNVEVFDSCTKDGIKELLIIKGVDSWTEYYLFRYKSGKLSKYCKVDADELVSQKKKNHITTKGYVFVKGIGNIYVTNTFKVKSGKLIITKDYSTPNKDNSKTTFKTNRKLTLYSDDSLSEKIGTLKKGAKIKLIKFKESNGEGYFTRICVKSKGLTGWIDTDNYKSSEFIINNPPLWN